MNLDNIPGNHSKSIYKLIQRKPCISSQSNKVKHWIDQSSLLNQDKKNKVQLNGNINPIDGKNENKLNNEIDRWHELCKN